MAKINRSWVLKFFILQSLPAVRFDAYHTKLKAWKAWREAMPNALQGRKARELDRRIVLSKLYGSTYCLRSKFPSQPRYSKSGIRRTGRKSS